MGVLNKIWGGVKALLGLILPFFAKTKEVGLSRPVRRVLGLILFAAILVGLWFLNYQVRGMFSGSGLLHDRLILPLSFLLVYLLIWTGWWLWVILFEPELSGFPDIDSAWAEAGRALREAGLDLTELPVFLVLGPIPEKEEALFQAGQVALKVKQAPRDLRAPVRVYANQEAVYVTCPDASLVGQYAAMLSGTVQGGLTVLPHADSADDLAKSLGEEVMKTMQSVGGLHGMVAIEEKRRKGLPLTEEEILAWRKMEETMGARKARPSLLNRKERVAELTARLEHLCRLVARDRRPFCPVNGILLAVPLAATATDDDAGETGRLIQTDLETARRVLQVRCPVFVEVCDLETVPGFREFVLRIPEGFRQRPLGKGYPLLPDLPGPKEVKESIENLVGWFTGDFLPTWIYKLFRVEKTPGPEEAAVVESNVHLYRFLTNLCQRDKRLSGILTRDHLSGGNGSYLFGGIYLAGTGGQPSDQAFAPGVFQRLIFNQNSVAWTEEAQEEEAWYRRWTFYGYVGVVALLLAAVAAAVYALGNAKS